MPEIQISVYREEAIRAFAPILNNWASTAYRKFPFLYASEGCMEALPYHVLCNDRDAFVLFAEKEGRRVGMLAGYPLDSSLHLEYSPPFAKFEEIRQKGFDPNQMFYIASFLVTDEERQNKALIEMMYHQVVTLAKEMKKKQICYFTTIREPDHALMPSPYVPVEPWDDLSTSFRSTEITFELIWPTLQADSSIRDCSNLQALFVQDI